MRLIALTCFADSNVLGKLFQIANFDLCISIDGDLTIVVDFVAFNFLEQVRFNKSFLRGSSNLDFFSTFRPFDSSFFELWLLICFYGFQMESFRFIST